MPRLYEAVAKVCPPLPQDDGASSDPAVSDMLVNAVQPVLRDMAAAIFTAERRQQLATQLKAYRNRLFANGDRHAAGCAQAAISYVEHEDEPGLNTFLICLCFQSTRTVDGPP